MSYFQVEIGKSVDMQLCKSCSAGFFVYNLLVLLMDSVIYSARLDREVIEKKNNTDGKFRRLIPH